MTIGFLVDNCVHLLGSDGRFKGQWAPGRCEIKMRYICERDGTKQKPVERTTPGIVTRTYCEVFALLGHEDDDLPSM